MLPCDPTSHPTSHRWLSAHASPSMSTSLAAFPSFRRFGEGRQAVKREARVLSIQGPAVAGAYGAGQALKARGLIVGGPDDMHDCGESLMKLLSHSQVVEGRIERRRDGPHTRDPASGIGSDAA